MQNLTPVYKQILTQMGLSENPSWIGRVDFFAIDWSKRRVVIDDEAWKIRAEKALGILFSVASEIAVSNEARDEKRVVIIFDELLDLVRQDRFSDSCGPELMDRICGLTVHHNIDKRDICIFFAGSSGFLLQELGSRRLHGTNCDVHTMTDPSEKEVLAAIEERGYDRTVAKQIVDGLGCRLRLLDRILREPVDVKQALLYVSKQREAALRDISDVLNTACKDETCRETCRCILDELTGLKPATKLWTIADLPVDIRNHRAVKVFYVDESYRLLPQNTPVILAWKSLSSE